MDALPDAIYSDPDAWRIESAASDGSLAVVTGGGAEPLFRLPGFRGSFSLRPSGLSGFDVAIDVPERERPPSRWGREAATLRWEATGLRPREGVPHGLEGRGVLTLGHRETWAALTGSCTPVPSARTGLPYLKIVLETVFASAALWWPRPARRRLRPVRLTLFAEIRPVRVGPGIPPRVPGPNR
jgi:hypothetical protein